MEADEWGIVKVKMHSTRTAKTEKEPEHDDDEEQVLNRQWAWDDVTGAELDPKTVAEEREKEL